MEYLDLRKSWKRTKAYLLEARSFFSEVAEGVCADEFESFNEYLEHNELELALDMLDEAFIKSNGEVWRVLELMAKAAASMELESRKNEYDQRLSEARGFEYHTQL